MRLLDRLLPGHPVLSLRATSDGFALLRDGLEQATLRWSDVVEILAFKRDLVTVDSVRLAFRTAPHPIYLEISEELEGFETVVAEMQSRFPSIPEDWLSVVTLPPFATNERRLFGEPSTLS